MKRHRFRLRLLPVIVFSAVVFLIVRAQSYSVRFDSIPNIPLNSSMELWDVFFLAKSSAILYITIWAALTMAFLLITGQMKIKKTPVYIPMLIYTVCVIVSYVTSNYKWIALNGCPGRFEGTRTIICYMFMLLYTINVVDELRDAVTVVSAVAIGMFAACLIGISQLTGHDIFLTEIGNTVVTGGSGLSLSGEFEPGQVYQTVANMNYVGMYLSLMVPVLIYVLLVLLSKQNKKIALLTGIDSSELDKLQLDKSGPDNKRRWTILIISTGLLLFLIIINIYGAGSLGGVLGIGTVTILLLVILSKRNIYKILFALIYVVGAVSALIITYARGTDNIMPVEYIETGSNYVRLSIDGNEINVIYYKDNDIYELKDSDGRSVDTYCFDGEDGQYQVDDKRFAGKIVLIPFKDNDGEACVIVDVKHETFGFTYYEDGVKYLNPFGEDVPLAKVNSFGFSNHLSLGSGRGYIWSRTIPLLKDRLLTGSGADTFLVVFPQDDYAGKYSSGAPLQITCDKPHNMFLNIAVGTGGISLIAFLSIIIMAMWRVFHPGEDRKFAKVIATGIIGFLVVGMFNDSSVCTMPVFYGMLGIVIAMGI